MRSALRAVAGLDHANATAQRTAASTNGTVSLVAAAIAPAAAGPTIAPLAHATFMNPKAIPCGSSASSAPSAISANAGVKRRL